MQQFPFFPEIANWFLSLAGFNQKAFPEKVISEKWSNGSALMILGTLRYNYGSGLG